MAGTNKRNAPIALDIPELEARYVDLGGYTVGFETYKVDLDPAPLFQGLPDDRCQCQHWGVVVSGSVTFRFANSTETYVTGDAYYAPPGHTPLISEGTEVVEFSPTDQLGATMAVLERNMAAAAGATA